MFTTYLFDLDGTLIDSIDLICSSYSHTIRTHLGLETDDEDWRRGIGRPLEWQLARYTEDQAELQQMIETYRSYNAEHHDQLVSPYGGALETVRELKARGHRLGVVTSKGREMALRGLSHAGFDGEFGAVIGIDQVAKPKPDPEPVLTALRLLDSRPAEAIFIGDSLPDLIAGRAAGVTTAAALWGPFSRAQLEAEQPDHWLESPAEILRLAT